jgi:hypothetical protein
MGEGDKGECMTTNIEHIFEFVKEKRRAFSTNFHEWKGNHR